MAAYARSVPGIAKQLRRRVADTTLRRPSSFGISALCPKPSAGFSVVRNQRRRLPELCSRNQAKATHNQLQDENVTGASPQGCDPSPRDRRLIAAYASSVPDMAYRQDE
eukprot:2040064-Rhodomonas_salina.1